MIWTSIIVCIILLAGIGSGLFLGKNNPIEEACEEAIEEITGIEEIDISFWKEGIEEEEIDGV